MDKTTIFWTAVGVILILLFFLSSVRLEGPSKEVRLVIDYGGGSVRTFVTDAKSGTSAWNLLQQADAHYDIGLEVGEGFFPQRIDGFKNGDGDRNWSWYKNGRPQNMAPIEGIISEGEEVLFKFE